MHRQHNCATSRLVRCPAQAGLSLIELIIFIVIIGVAVTGVLSVMNVTVQHSADPLVRKQALAVAESLLEEILAHDFQDPAGAEPEASRALYDDVADYAGYSMAPIVDISGSPIGGLAGYSAGVVVDAAASLGGIAAGDVKQVIVTVTSSSGEAVALSGFRTRH